MRTPSLALVLLAALAAPAVAEPTTVTVGGTTRALRRASADAVTGSSLDGTQLTVARGLGLALPYGLALAAEAGVGWGSATGTMLQTLDTTLGNVDLTVGARASLRPWHHLGLSGHVDLGAAHAGLGIHDRSGRGVADGAWGARTAIGLAGDLVVLDLPQVGLALRVELAYVETSAVGLVAHQDQASDGTLKLPMTEASLGHLDLSGPAFAISLLGRL
jgi:hypothetical protein